MSTMYFMEEDVTWKGEPTKKECQQPFAKPLQGILKNAVCPEEQNKSEENGNPHKRFKKNFFECPTFLRRDWLSLGKRILYGTNRETFESEEDSKVAILCCNVPSSWILWVYGIISMVFLVFTALAYVDKHIIYYEAFFPWLVAFSLSISVLIAMGLKVPKLLQPFRGACALLRCIILAVLTGTFLYMVLASLVVYIAGHFSSSNIGKEVFNAVLIMVANGVSYLALGVVASAATRSYHYLKNRE